MENHHFNRQFNYKWANFNSKLLVYQRVALVHRLASLQELSPFASFWHSDPRFPRKSPKISARARQRISQEWNWTISASGWWFGTCFIFPYIGNNHPNWLIFFRGVQTTNQMMLVKLQPNMTRLECPDALSRTAPLRGGSWGSLESLPRQRCTAKGNQEC